MNAAETNEGVVHVCQYDAVLCFSERSRAVHSLVDYELEWADEHARTVTLDMLGLEIIEVLSVREAPPIAEIPASRVQCSHTKGSHRKHYGCCTPPPVTVRGRLEYCVAEQKIQVRVPRNTRRIRAKFRLPLYNTAEDGQSQDAAKLEDALQWWGGRGFLHSAGGHSGQMCLLPYVDSVDQLGDWNVKVCVPEGYGVYVSSPLPAPPVPQKCRHCDRLLFEFSVPKLVPASLGIVIARNLQYKTLFTDPFPFHVVCQMEEESPLELSPSLSDVVSIIVQGLMRLFGDFPFSSYTVCAVHCGWTLQGLAVHSGCLLNESALVGVTMEALEAYATAPMILAHEMSHSWFGGVIKGATAEDHWLDESFAVYCELRIVQLGLGASEQSSMLQYLARSCVAEKLAESSLASISAEGKSVISGDYRVIRSKGFLILVKLMLQYGCTGFDDFISEWVEHGSDANGVAVAVDTDSFLTFFARHAHKALGRHGNSISPQTLRGWLDSDTLATELRCGTSTDIEESRRKKILTVQKDVARVLALGGAKQVMAIGKWQGKALLWEKVLIFLDKWVERRESYVSMCEEAGVDGAYAEPVTEAEVRGVLGCVSNMEELRHDAEVQQRLYELVLLTKCAAEYRSLECFALLFRDHAPYIISCALLYPKHSESRLAYYLHRELVHAGQTASATARLDRILEFRLGPEWQKAIRNGQDQLHDFMREDSDEESDVSTETNRDEDSDEESDDSDDEVQYRTKRRRIQ